MSRLPLPEMPEGNLLDLMTELHRLHARAGWPSTRTLAKNQNFSHMAVHELFTRVNPQLKLPVLLAVVHHLAEDHVRTHRIPEDRREAHVNGVLDRFDRLWSAATREPFGGTATPLDAASGSGVPALRASLTDREDQLLGYLLAGFSLVRISELSYTSKSTVALLTRRVLSKMGVGTAADLREMHSRTPLMEDYELPHPE